jgi:hypothetical protein
LPALTSIAGIFRQGPDAADKPMELIEPMQKEAVPVVRGGMKELSINHTCVMVEPARNSRCARRETEQVGSGAPGGCCSVQLAIASSIATRSGVSKIAQGSVEGFF